MEKNFLISEKGLVFEPQYYFFEDEVEKFKEDMKKYYQYDSILEAFKKEWLQKETYIHYWEGDVPSDEELKEILSKNDWDFRYTTFRFGRWKDQVRNVLLSVNPLKTDSEYYLGTIEECQEVYGRLPMRATVIVNNANNEQLFELYKITARGKAFIATDSTSGTGFFTNVNTEWYLMFV